MIKWVFKKDFVRNVMVLTSGTVLAQVLTYLLAPLISRIYTQSQMADLGLYMRIIAFLTVFATAKFELTLPLPKADHHSFLLYKLTVRIANYFFIACVILCIIYVILFQAELDFIFLLILALISTFFMVYINLGTSWSIRNGNFKSISRQRIINSILTNSLKLGFGLIGLLKWGLIIATTIGTILSSLGFLKTYLRKKKTDQHLTSNSKTKLLVQQYKHIPFITFPHVIIDLGRDLIIAFIILLFYGKENFGSFTFAVMLLSVPISFIGQSIGQVFLNKASEMKNNNLSISKLVLNNFKILFLISVIPFTILGIYGEGLFVLIFGENWSNAGKMAEIMSPWMMLNFIISPLSNLPVIVNQQKVNFIIGFIATLLQLVSICILPLIYGKVGSDIFTSLYILTYSQVLILLVSSLFYIKIGK